MEEFFLQIQVKTKKLLQTSSSAQMQIKVKLLGGIYSPIPRVSASLHPATGGLKTHQEGYLRPSQVEGMIGTTSQLLSIEFMS